MTIKTVPTFHFFSRNLHLFEFEEICFYQIHRQND